MYQLSAVLGLRIAERWRTELEYTEHENSPEILFGTMPDQEIDPDREDAVRARGYMLNAIRELSIGTAWQPYIGIGVGYADVDLHFSDGRVNGTFVQRPRVDLINDGDKTFAWQLLAGFSVPVRPWLTLAADYRYWQANDLSLSEVDGAPLSTDHAVRSVWLRARVHAPRDRSAVSTRPRAGHGRWYLSSRAGGGFTEDMGLEGELTIDAFDPGPAATLTIGYAANERWAVELEGGVRNNGVEVIEVGPDIGEDGASGDALSYSLMANVVRRFRPDSAVRPYLGLGAGGVRFDADVEQFGFCEAFICGERRRATFIDDAASAAAFQVFAGVEVALSRRLQFLADYRYLVSARLTMEQEDGTPFKGNYKTTSVVAGLRYWPGSR